MTATTVPSGSGGQVNQEGLGGNGFLPSDNQTKFTADLIQLLHVCMLFTLPFTLYLAKSKKDYKLLERIYRQVAVLCTDFLI